MILLAVDPAKKATGWAYFLSNRLHECGLVREKTVPGMIEKLRFELASLDPDDVVVEGQRVVERRRERKQDLIDVALVAGSVLGMFASSAKLHDPIMPEVWKGQTPKDICGRRVLQVLLPQEKAAIVSVPESLEHNVLDAIGIGLYHLGRF